jgi:hypothetical protein
MKKKKIWKVDTNSNSMKKVLQILKDPILFSKIMKLENQLQNEYDKRKNVLCKLMG